MSSPTIPATPPSADDFLFGGGANRKGRSVSFLQIGATVTGTITEPPTTEQKRDVDGSLKTWDNGDPIWQIVVPLQTTLRSLDVENDNGIRYLYVSGSRKPESRSMHAAVAAAVQAAGAKGLEVGGKLTVTYTNDGAKTKAAFNAPKQYSAEYVSAANSALLAAPETAPAHTAAHPQAVSSPVGDLPYPAYLSVEQVNGLRAAGINPVQAAAMFPPPVG